MAKLTPKQERFCEEYLIDLNATQAYKRAGYSAKEDITAAQNAAKLLKNTKVQEHISELRSQRSKRTEITADKVIAELAAIAFADRTDIARVNKKGEINFFPTDKLPDDVKKSITQIKYGKFGVEVSTADKVKALELLGRHLGIFDKHDDNADALAKLDEVLKQIGGD